MRTTRKLLWELLWVWLIVGILIMVIAVSAGCEVRIESAGGGPSPSSLRPSSPYPAVAPVEIPQALRQENYGRGGSCMYASLIPLLRWQGLDEQADWLRHNYRGAQDVDGLARIIQGQGWRIAYTLDGDAGFLDWCSRTRRGAAIHYTFAPDFYAHAVTFCGYQNGQAVLLDNNDTLNLIKIPKTEFVRNWRAYGGRALTIVYSPPPRKPWR